MFHVHADDVINMAQMLGNDGVETQGPTSFGSRMCVQAWLLKKIHGVRDVFWILEQPSSSQMFDIPELKAAVRLWELALVSTWMGCFGSILWKQTKLLSNMGNAKKFLVFYFYQDHEAEQGVNPYGPNISLYFFVGDPLHHCEYKPRGQDVSVGVIARPEAEEEAHAITKEGHCQAEEESGGRGQKKWTACSMLLQAGRGN